MIEWTLHSSFFTLHLIGGITKKYVDCVDYVDYVDFEPFVIVGEKVLAERCVSIRYSIGYVVLRYFL